MLPVPCGPDTLAIAYTLKLGKEVIPLIHYFDTETIFAGEKSTIVFEQDANSKTYLFTLFSTNHPPESSVRINMLPVQNGNPVTRTYENVVKSFNIFYRDDKAKLLKQIQEEIENSLSGRRRITIPLVAMP
ncbi:hypothetical protein [Undibacterium sp. Rencai35W]|uniref:hypothetical protein n=1 Tax=Undibacterium sp. Rencai35W TaxID=3413046 RepID=UPI003BF4BC04